MAVNTKKLKRFLESIIAHTESADLRLSQLTVTGRRNTVWVSEKKWMLEDVVPMIVESAKSVAEGQGRTKFLLQGFDPDADDACLGTVGFSMEPEEAIDEGESVMSEPPTAVGLLSQLMRHNSDLHRQSSGTWGMMFAYMTRMIEKLTDQNEKLSTEKMAAAETMEALISKKHQRDMESREQEADMKRKDEMWGKVMMLLPVVVNKLAGKEIVRQNDTAFEITTAEFLKTITGEKIEQFISTGTLDKHQMTLLLTMLEQLSKRMLPAEEKGKSAQIAGKAVFGSLGDALSNLITTGGSPAR